MRHLKNCHVLLQIFYTLYLACHSRCCTTSCKLFVSYVSHTVVHI
uniref:C2H2-type domain-containing protein n=1 Tax=Setaria viridis TaxID=4556 RepID=A0A4U6VZX3_SETVI|nr:hypothetical protein SEVIR_2G253950v2 [Setaria viridis]